MSLIKSNGVGKLFGDDQDTEEIDAPTLGAFAKCLSPSEYSELMNGLKQVKAFEMQMKLLRNARQAGISTLKEIPRYLTDLKRRVAEIKSKSVRSEKGYSNMGTKRRKVNPEVVGVVGKTNCSGSGEALSADVLEYNQEESTDDLVGEACIHGPGNDLLSNRELLFCKSTRILPYHYLAIKDYLVRYVFWSRLVGGERWR